MTRRLGNATNQLLYHAIIQRLKKLSTNPVVLRTDTLETTQDMKIDTIKINASCAYFVGIIGKFQIYC